MIAEPPPTRTMGTNQAHALGINAYEGRWRWWYSNIADWMIRNPGGKLKDCAAELKKAENTISMITNTDLFRDYYAARKAEFARDHDFSIRNKLTQVTELALDATIEKLTKQRDKIDLPLLTDLLGSSLDRLGFAPKVSPQVQINQQIGDNRTQVVQLPGSVTALALEEARMALRAVQLQSTLPATLVGPQKGAEPLLGQYDRTSLVLEAESEGDRGVDSSDSS
jgi:hypothetical protein